MRASFVESAVGFCPDLATIEKVLFDRNEIGFDIGERRFCGHNLNRDVEV
jgi:hypothetical protein